MATTDLSSHIFLKATANLSMIGRGNAFGRRPAGLVDSPVYMGMETLQGSPRSLRSGLAQREGDGIYFYEKRIFDFFHETINALFKHPDFMFQSSEEVLKDVYSRNHFTRGRKR